MNNTHTSGLIKETRMMLGMTNYRSGVSTPSGNNGNILENSMRSQNGNNSLEESKLSYRSDNVHYAHLQEKNDQD